MSSNNNGSKKVKYIKGIHRHGSETFLLVSRDLKSLEFKSIIKSATTQIGINSIISEHKGIIWYNDQTANKIIFNYEKKTKNYNKIEINLNKGFFNIKSDLPYLKLKKYLDLTVNHYIEVWQKYKNQKFAPLHGDLSLVGNVMFNNKDEVLFVDWEQFDNISNIPTGLDPIMTIIENIWYESLRSKQINKDVMKHIKSLVTGLSNAKLLSPLLKKTPAQTAIEFIKCNQNIWNSQYFKLPALKIPNRYIKEIDNAVAN